MDPEKAKFIAVPNTPPDAKPAPTLTPVETLAKAVPTAAKESSSSTEKKQPEPSKDK